MRTRRDALRKTTLSEAEFAAALAKVLAHLAEHATVNNTDVRRITGLGYDQAIKFFKTAVTSERLVRIGNNAGTRYHRPVGGKSD